MYKKTTDDQYHWLFLVSLQLTKLTKVNYNSIEKMNQNPYTYIQEVSIWI